MRLVYLATLISAKRDTTTADIAAAKTKGENKTERFPFIKSAWRFRTIGLAGTCTNWISPDSRNFRNSFHQTTIQTMTENRSSIGQDFSNLNLVSISNVFRLFMIGVSNDIKQHFLIFYSYGLCDIRWDKSFPGWQIDKIKKISGNLNRM